MNAEGKYWVPRERFFIAVARFKNPWKTHVFSLENYDEDIIVILSCFSS